MKSMAAGVGQRAAHGAVQAGRAQVDVVVQAEPQLQQHLAFDDPGRDPGVTGGRAHSAEQDGVPGPEIGQDLVRAGSPRWPASARHRACIRLLELHAFGRNGLLQDLDGLGNDLRANAVAGNNCQINGGCAHGFRVAKSSICWSSRLIIRTPAVDGSGPSGMRPALSGATHRVPWWTDGTACTTGSGTIPSRWTCVLHARASSCSAGPVYLLGGPAGPLHPFHAPWWCRWPGGAATRSAQQR